MQKPELTSPSICHAPGGEYFVEGETWNIDSCTQCTCHSGRVLCETEVCPPLLCQNPTRTQDSCCPQCPGIYWQLVFISLFLILEFMLWIRVVSVCAQLVVAFPFSFSVLEFKPAVLPFQLQNLTVCNSYLICWWKFGHLLWGKVNTVRVGYLGLGHKRKFAVFILTWYDLRVTWRQLANIRPLQPSSRLPHSVKKVTGFALLKQTRFCHLLHRVFVGLGVVIFPGKVFLS